MGRTPLPIRPLTNEQRDLAEKYMPLAESIAKRAIGRGGAHATRNREDYFSEAAVGLIEAESGSPRSQASGLLARSWTIAAARFRKAVACEAAD